MSGLRRFFLIFLAFVGALHSEPAKSTWASPVALTQGMTGKGGVPQVAVNGKGDAVAAWRKFDGVNYVIQASVKRHKGFWQSIPTTLSMPGQNAQNPQVAIDDHGNATAVWSRFDGTNMILQASSRPNKGTWTAPVDISVPGQDATDPQVAVDCFGNVTAVWSRSDGSNLVIQASFKPRCGSWQAPSTLSQTGQDANDPQIGIDGSGNATVVWQRSDGSNLVIQASTKPYGGSWQATPDTLSISGQDALEQEIAVNSRGDAVAIWVRSDGSNERVQASLKPYGGNWQASPDALSLAGTDADAPCVAIDRCGNATAAWCDIDGGGFVLASTKHHGGAWQDVPDTISPSGANSRYPPHIVVDKKGNATVLWTSSSGIITNVFSSTKPYSGHWQEIPDQVSEAGVDSLYSPVGVDVHGNVTTVWMGIVDSSSLFIIKSSTNSIVPVPPSDFVGAGKLKGDKVLLKVSWEKSPTVGVVRYEIFSRKKCVKKVSASKTKSLLYLRPHHIPYHFSKDYKRYLGNKYRIRAVGANGVASGYTKLVMEH